MTRHAPVKCADCAMLLPPARMRQKVESFARTVGAGGTNSDVKLQQKLPVWLCDACVRRRESGGVVQGGLLGDA